MRRLKAGPLECGYENGFLRRVTYGNVEILRMIYFALRDHNWNSIESKIEDERILQNEKDFEITYTCSHFDGGKVVMQWRALLRGNTDGSLTFQIEGVVKQDFRKNRAGFCVLHALDVAGRECSIAHPDGSRSNLIFPVMVAAENPFTNIRSMSWKNAGTEFQLEFEGDIFETEDQRNWGDASYKTFCTPLDKPFPVTLKEGEKVFQRVTFRPLQALRADSGRSAFIELMETDAESLFPRLGICASTETGIISETASDLLRSLRLHHYRIDIYPARADWVTEFSSGYEQSFSLGLPLEVALHLTDNFLEEMEAFKVICQQNKVRLRKVLCLRDRGLMTDQAVLDQLSTLQTAFTGIQFGAGTNYNFNEINKNLRDASGADYISFSIDPQEHAIDNTTILENIGACVHLVNSAKAIYGKDKPVHISPLTLRKRFNPYATNPDDLFIPEELKADPRLKTALGAVWLFGSLCSLAMGGAQSVTVLQTVGNQGIMTVDGTPFPVYEVLKILSAFQGRPMRNLRSSHPLSVEGILFDASVLVLVNYTSELQTVRWRDSEFQLKGLEVQVNALNRAE